MRVVYCINRIERYGSGLTLRVRRWRCSVLQGGDISINEPIRGGLHHVTAGGRGLGKPMFQGNCCLVTAGMDV